MKQMIKLVKQNIKSYNKIYIFKRLEESLEVIKEK